MRGANWNAELVNWSLLCIYDHYYVLVAITMYLWPLLCICDHYYVFVAITIFLRYILTCWSGSVILSSRSRSTPVVGPYTNGVSSNDFIKRNNSRWAQQGSLIWEQSTVNGHSGRLAYLTNVILTNVA